MKLKPEFISSLPLVDYFVKAISSGKISNSMLHKQVLKKIDSLDDFDNSVKSLNYEIVDFESNDFGKNQQDFIKIINLIRNERQNLLKHFKKNEKSNYISKLQERVILLSEEAFEPMGNNKLNIKENKSEYSLIFG